MRLRLTGTLAILVALALVALSFLSAWGTPATDTRLPKEAPAALDYDAQHYADSYGVEPQEASRRLQLQGSIGQLGATLEAEERETYAGLWIQHRPDYRIIALFTRDGERTIRRYVAGGPLADIIETRSARFTLTYLEGAQKATNQSLRLLGIPANTGLNMVENRAEILVTGRSQLDSAVSAGRLRLLDGVVVITVPGLATPASAGKIATPTRTNAR